MRFLIPLIFLTSFAAAADTPPSDHDLIVALQAQVDAADALQQQTLDAIARLSARVRTLEAISRTLQSQMLDAQLTDQAMYAAINAMVADIAAIKAQLATLLGLG